MKLEPSAITPRLMLCQSAGRQLRISAVSVRNRVILLLAEKLEQKSEEILVANRADIAALPDSATTAFRDRLMLDRDRITSCITGLRQVASEPDPVGVVVDAKTLPNGLSIRRESSPLGVIFLIFESRPNVAIEAFSLAIKSGNAIILRGGKESVCTTRSLYQLLTEALLESGLDPNCVWGISDPDRSIVQSLLAQKQFIDVVVPRGGTALIDFVVDHATMPVIKNDRGLCHVYVDQAADISMALAVIENAKTQRPGVCNSMETVLIHTAISTALVPELYRKLAVKKVRWFGCEQTMLLMTGKPEVSLADDSHYQTEYLDLIINCKIVPSIDGALQHIERFGSRHSEAIITENEGMARRFQNEVDAAVVYWNASTRFTDGFCLGLGGELGISTQKLHVRGPVGLRELTSLRWIIDGNGQVRD